MALTSAQAVVSLPVVVGPIFGPVLGGLLIQHLSWPWIFYVNVPVCAIAMALARHRDST
ncbi:MFS transporter [Nocardia sp. alder85J]|uniref:MFS transporter n=1 Tax=Nocardia sp. alder85J TaxID=2862949 RepID=UPI001CD40976|nr:MFS transporter [Nocardia sp. alder85J]MCX4099282.1 MFS transporter [Nocardia sp. alder85J]